MMHLACMQFLKSPGETFCYHFLLGIGFMLSKKSLYKSLTNTF